MATFLRDPMEFVVGETRPCAVEALTRYYASFTGRHFDRPRPTEPNKFTEADLVAVTMLSVAVPADAGAAILYDKSLKLDDLLEGIGPSDITIWDEGANLSSQGDAWKLWDKLGMRTGGPQMRGMGRTIRSKLLATKRPHLFPIFDQYLGTALLRRDGDDWWELWQKRLRGLEGERLRDQVENVRREADIALRKQGLGGIEALPILRVLDVVIWMSEHSS
jgi:hypothetical protein